MTVDLLHRLRVVVTRPREQAATLVGALERHGAEAVSVPTIRIEDPPDGGLALRAGLRSLGADDWVVITSPNGAVRVAAAIAEQPLVAGVRVAVVGPGTKARAEAEGLIVDLVPDDAIAEGLVARFPARPPTGGRVLLARAEIARETLPVQLAFMGWNVDDVVAYRTVAVEVDGPGRRACADADAVAFTSGSTVESLVAAVGADGLPPTVFAIGPATAAEADRLGVTVDAVAAEHTIPGLVDAIRAHYADRPYVHGEDADGEDGRWCRRQARAESARRLGDPDPAALPSVADEVFVVARLDGRAIGCGGFARTAPATIDVGHLWVASDARRRGVGRALLDRLIAEASRLGCRQARLTTSSAFPEAIALCRSAAFVEVPASEADPGDRRRFALDLD